MFGKRSLFVFVFIVALFALAVASCNCAPKSASKAPYVIGAIFSYTGDNAPLGVPERNTVEMLAKQVNAAGGINGHPIKVIYYDDQGKPEVAAQACQDLLADKKVVAIIGPTLTGPSLAIATMCQNAGMPLISCAASVKIVEPVKTEVFKTAQTDSLAVARLIDYLKSKKITKVGFINDANAFGASGREQWRKHLDKGGHQDRRSGIILQRGYGYDGAACQDPRRQAAGRSLLGHQPRPGHRSKEHADTGHEEPLLMSHGIADTRIHTACR